MKPGMTRREMLGALATAAPFLATAPSLVGAEASRLKRLGVCIYSYSNQWRTARENHANVRFRNSLEFLEYCRELGAGGVQVAVGSKEPDYASKLRARAEAGQMYFEGQVSLPQDESDVSRFDTDVRAAKEAGAEIVRAAMLSGRRYETFDSAAAFGQFAEKSWRSLTLAEPVLRKRRVRLAVENHKDWRVPELLGLLKRISSEHVGVCVDTGNSIALVEEPMEVIEALAPYAFSIHLKDMAVQEYEEGFLLSEVPLGEGFLDLEKVITLLEKANPEIQFNLEMITRDPLKIPCLTRKYWATMETALGSQLARMLALVRAKSSPARLPHTTGLSLEEKFELEDRYVRESFGFARRRLRL
jgi:sugar phosphate isomerase/epimerase